MLGSKTLLPVELFVVQIRNAHWKRAFVPAGRNGHDATAPRAGLAETAFVHHRDCGFECRRVSVCDISGGYVLEPRSVDPGEPHAALPGILLTVWLKVAMDELRHRPEERIVKETLRPRVAEKKLGPAVKDDEVERASLMR